MNKQFTMSDILKKQNKECYYWFSKLDIIKQAKIIESSYRNYALLSNMNSDNSYTIGKLKEDQLEKIIKSKYNCARVSNINKSGDLLIEHNNHKILVEIKDYSKQIPYTEVYKFIRDLERNNVDYGIFISTTKVSRINNRIELIKINGKVIYFINIEQQSEAIIENILNVCIDAIISLKEINIYENNENVIKNISNNLNLLHDIKKSIYDTKFILTKELDKLYVNINIYEEKIRDQIKLIKTPVKLVSCNKKDIENLINIVSNIDYRNFLSNLINLIDLKNVFINKNMININNKFYIDIKKRKPQIKFEIQENQVIKKDWEVKKGFVFINLDPKYYDDIKNIFIKLNTA